MRRPIIAGNWKMNTNVAEAIALVRLIKDDLDKMDGIDKVLCPPFVSLAPLAELLCGASVALGAQNLFFEEKGAYTGEISAPMLAPLCRYVIIGHSERRQYFGETDEMVNKKVITALRHGLIPILCVGENLEQNERGETRVVVERQAERCLMGVTDSDLEGMVIAYEPIWAIGTGRPATGEGANEVIGFIRALLAKRYGRQVADRVRLQYGGSVTAANIAEFVSQAEIDGALVGGASLKAREFVSIVDVTAKIKGKRD
ncbi:MAG: triose-phosphate isomerase [Chloroflexi bacterium]|nr:triose-phosphate isomerase [Chloroflexota bacterium]MCL5074804.1 triose-phosphate isomerase [Chloroflexota bacterium]